jgi:hypothetical protein
MFARKSYLTVGSLVAVNVPAAVVTAVAARAHLHRAVAAVLTAEARWHGTVAAARDVAVNFLQNVELTATKVVAVMARRGRGGGAAWLNLLQTSNERRWHAAVTAARRQH